MKIKGKLNIKELKEKVATETIETIIVAFTDHYGRLVGKRFDAEFFLESAVEEGTHSCDYLLTTDMEMEPIPGYTFASWELGYGDFHLVPDMNTLRIADWLEKWIWEYQGNCSAKAGTPDPIVRRSMTVPLHQKRSRSRPS